MSAPGRQRFADTDWVNFTVTRDINAGEPAEKTGSGTIFDSNYALKTGLDVEELDTVPAELLDLFK